MPTKQWLEDNKEAVKARKKAYYEANKEHLRKKQIEWEIRNEEAFKQYHQSYYEANKEAIKEKRRAYYQANKERVKQRVVEYRVKNKDLRKDLEAARHKKYREENKEKIALSWKKWCEKNPAKRRHYVRSRQAAQMQRTPKWLTKEQFEQIQCFYHEAKMLEVETGIKHHVDHIIPLKGKLVSGLHVPENLRVIPASENMRKFNQYQPS
jgi:hypothetical protein